MGPALTAAILGAGGHVGVVWTVVGLYLSILALGALIRLPGDAKIAEAAGQESAVIELSERNLKRLPAALPGPRYDRRIVTPGIARFGVGGFHRAHQAYHLDRLMSQGLALDLGIVGVGLLEGDRLFGPRLSAPGSRWSPTWSRLS
ncbi:MAG: hypothetical protein LBD97_06615 [Bifidobacteriaceae bacterium]|nr:hypothetical protein [Bifidobacteriaceae bacterium]